MERSCATGDTTWQTIKSEMTPVWGAMEFPGNKVVPGNDFLKDCKEVPH